MLKRIAPAKLNLGLHVLRRRSDGYHDIETVMTPIGWGDELTYRPSPHFRFTTSRDDIPTDDRNLCVRAMRGLAAAIGEQPRGHLHLAKNIPHGAGLGGGSSDAAATLLLLNDAWDASMPNSRLVDLAGTLGSDVPFFMEDGPALVEGRGEEVRRLDFRPPILDLACAVVMPPVRISTAEAYALVQPNGIARPDLLEILRSDDPDRWRRSLVNDFEGPIAERHPEIGEERDRLVRGGAVYAAMTGSGAAVFGFFQSLDLARKVAGDARDRGLAAWAG